MDIMLSGSPYPLVLAQVWPAGWNLICIKMNRQTNLILDNTKIWLCSSSGSLSIECLSARISSSG